MADRGGKLDFVSTNNEQQRAFDHFCSLLAVHNAAILAFEVLPTLPDFEIHVATAFRVKDGLKSPDGAESYSRRAQTMSEIMATESSRNYQVIRGSALIAVCAAFEYLIKATFVSQAAFNPGAAASKLADTKIRVRACDVLGTPETEQWFAIADTLFTQLAESNPSLHKRVSQFLSEYAYLFDKQEDAEAMKKKLVTIAADHKFDEAFLTHNCLVHNGGRVSAALSNFTGQPTGDLIVLGKGVLGPMFKPMRDLADHLSALWV